MTIERLHVQMHLRKLLTEAQVTVDGVVPPKQVVVDLVVEAVRVGEKEVDEVRSPLPAKSKGLEPGQLFRQKYK